MRVVRWNDKRFFSSLRDEGTGDNKGIVVIG